MNASSGSVRCTDSVSYYMDDWFTIYDNHRLRRDYPDAYHDELLRRADEMDRQRLIDWRQWRDLRVLADKSYLGAVAGSDFSAPTEKD